MLDYEKLYRILFNGITDALSDLEKEDYMSAKETLIRVQQAAEDYYICGEEDEENRAESTDTAPRMAPYLYVPPQAPRR